MNVNVILADIQSNLKAPKTQFNKFGGYNYRSCEDIVEAVKPLLGEATLTLSDEMIEVGGRVYVKATARLTSKEGSIEVSACAREAETKKGMDDAQITGSASSYARKYALNGLFAIDDTKDADATNNHGKEVTKIAPNQGARDDVPADELPFLEELAAEVTSIIANQPTEAKQMIRDANLEEPQMRALWSYLDAPTRRILKATK